MKEARTAASQRVPVRALCYSSVINQLFGDHRDRAALQTGISRQVGARYWLMRSNQSENDASIYVALRFARRHLKVAQINLSHLNLPASSIESALPIRYTVIIS